MYVYVYVYIYIYTSVDPCITCTEQVVEMLLVSKLVEAISFSNVAAFGGGFVRFFVRWLPERPSRGPSGYRRPFRGPSGSLIFCVPLSLTVPLFLHLSLSLALSCSLTPCLSFSFSLSFSLSLSRSPFRSC